MIIHVARVILMYKGIIPLTLCEHSDYTEIISWPNRFLSQCQQVLKKTMQTDPSSKVDLQNST